MSQKTSFREHWRSWLPAPGPPAPGSFWGHGGHPYYQLGICKTGVNIFTKLKHTTHSYRLVTVLTVPRRWTGKEMWIENWPLNKSSFSLFDVYRWCNHLTWPAELEDLPGYVLSNRVFSALFYPGQQATEAGWAGDVKNKEHSVDISVVVLNHGLAKALLSCGVPELELDIRVRHF